MARLVADRVTKRHARGRRSTLALHDVSLVIDGPELVAVQQLEPQGRKALTLVLAGQARPDAGTVTFDGMDVYANRRLLGPHAIAVAIDTFPPANGSTLLEHVALPLRLNGATRAEAYTASLSVMERVGADGVRSSHPHDVESGDRVRVAIARAIVLRPSVLLVNGLTSNVALVDRDPFVALLRDLAHDEDEGMAVVLMGAEAIPAPDRALALHSGILDGDTTPAAPAQVLPLRRISP